MLIIRLQRTGKTNASDFRIVLAEKQHSVSKKFQEVLGSYNPRRKTFQVNKDRVAYWLSQHIAMSPTVHNLFVTQGVMQGAKTKAYSTPKKAVEEAKPAEAAVEAPVEAPSDSAPTETPAETPVEESQA